MLKFGLAVVLAVGLGGCVPAEERQWMKIRTPYTSAEFQRDLAECSKSGKLDDACMQARGWVALTPRSDKPKEFDPRDHSPRYGPVNVR